MENFDALSLVIISLGAFLLPLLAEKINIPSIVLEIAYGILVGPVLGIVKISEFISGLAIFGFMLLMFLSGFEIELDTFREKGLKTLSVPLSCFLLVIIVSIFSFLQTLKISKLSVPTTTLPIFKFSTFFATLTIIGSPAIFLRSFLFNLKDFILAGITIKTL